MMGLFPVMLVIFFTIFAQTQQTIYRLNIDVKVAGRATSGVTAGLSSSLMLEQQSPLTFDELYASSTSYEFLHLFAQLLVEDQDFRKINLTRLNAKRVGTWEDSFSGCNENKKCFVDRMTGLIGQFYDIRKGQTDGRFIFEISSLDPITTRVIARIITKAIEKARAKNIQIVYQEQARLAEEMIQKSREEMVQRGGIGVLNEYKNNELRLQELKERISSMQNTINQDKSLLATTEFKLHETSARAKDSDVQNIEKLSVVNFKKKASKVEDYRQNIVALNSIPESYRTESDKLVLKQMKDELKKMEDELRNSSRNTRKLSEEETFINQQQSNKSYIDFDYQVLKRKIEKENLELKSMTAEMEGYIEGNLKLESTSSILRQDLEYIKLLESKLISIKLMMATITSDLVFEKYSGDLIEFNRSTSSKNFLYSLILTCTILLVALITRYLLDDRIYEEHEIEKCFKDLPIIGKTPDFD